MHLAPCPAAENLPQRMDLKGGEVWTILCRKAAQGEATVHPRPHCTLNLEYLRGHGKSQKTGQPPNHSTLRKWRDCVASVRTSPSSRPPISQSPVPLFTLPRVGARLRRVRSPRRRWGIKSFADSRLACSLTFESESAPVAWVALPGGRGNAAPPYLPRGRVGTACQPSCLSRAPPAGRGATLSRPLVPSCAL